MAPGLIVLVGPTAAGKSAAALALCEAAGGELISADSVQVYRGFDIGSAKASAADRARVRHWCLDLADPGEPCDAATWAAEADRAVADIQARGRLAVVCGGTGFYIRALLHGLSPVPDVPEAIRAEVAALLAAAGPEAAHALLTGSDPEAAARLHPRDTQRIGRALAVARATGRSLTAWQRAAPSGQPRYPAAQLFGLWPARPALYARIEARARGLLAAGLVAEVRHLVAAGVPTDHGPLTSLGYREVVQHLAGALPLARLADAIAAGHRRYARRQLTWFRGITTREDALVHLDPDQDPVSERLLAAATAASSRIAPAGEGP